MKKQIVSILLGITVITSMSVSGVFADTTDNGKNIENAEQLKAAIACAMEDGALSEQEESQIMDRATDEAVSDLMQEKLDAAVETLNEIDTDQKMQRLADGSEYANWTYDLGDGCLMTVELTDREEGVGACVTAPLTATSTGEWKDYGNRYFTAKTTVTVAGYSVMLGLENHYVLSSNGIDENYGKGIYDKKGTACLIFPGKEYIEDSAARTPGASDVNMYCTFTCRAGSNESKYKLDTTVQYLAHDISGKRIKVGHTWKLTKLA